MRTILKRQWPLVGLLVVLGVLGFYLLRAGKEMIPEPLRQIVAGRGLTLQDIHYTHDAPDKGLKWILDAERVKVSENKDFIEFNSFRLRVEPTGRPWLEVEGDRGEYSKATGEISLHGNVKGVTEHGYRLATEHLVVHEEEGRVTSDEAVRLSGPFFEVSGTGLRADLRENRLKILSHVTTVIDKESMNL